MPVSSSPDLALLRGSAHQLTGGKRALDPLIHLAGDASFVLLGEATHGTHEFYSTRAAITERLIKEKGFQAVAVEADWPSAYRVNGFVRGRNNDVTPAQALSAFTRFPVWMWRNQNVETFIAWLRQHNDSRPD